MADYPGGPGNDTLSGSAFDDTMHGYANDDLIYGQSGPDTIYGGTGSDDIYGGDGDDLIYGDGGHDLIEGGGAIDTIYGGGGNDVISIGTLYGGSSGFLNAGTGDDYVTVFAAANTVTLEGGAGSDTLRIFWPDAYTQYDALIDYATKSATSSAGYSLSFVGFERLATYLGAGNDSVFGSGASDDIWVGRGNNLVDAGGGNDHVRYDIGGQNTLEGGAGDDVLTVIAGTTPLYFIYDSYDGQIDEGQLSVITGFERFEIAGHSGNDIVVTPDGRDTVYGSWGDDTLFGSGGMDLLEGGRDHDQLDGGTGSDVLTGGQGNDTLQGGADSDVLAGNGGDDSLDGGTGWDRLVGGLGNDTLTGGTGHDDFMFRQNDPGNDLITDFTSGEDRVFWSHASLGPMAPPLGMTGSAALQDGGPVGTTAQFVTQYDVVADETALLWYDAGTDTHGAFHLLRFAGHVTLAAGDMWLI